MMNRETLRRSQQKWNKRPISNISGGTRLKAAPKLKSLGKLQTPLRSQKVSIDDQFEWHSGSEISL